MGLPGSSPSYKRLVKILEGLACLAQSWELWGGGGRAFPGPQFPPLASALLGSWTRGPGESPSSAALPGPDPEGPLSAEVREQRPVSLPGPPPRRGLKPGISGPGSGVNGICFSSFQLPRRSVLADTSNFWHKGKAE